MKKFYLVSLLLSSILSAQTHISFEADEGFELGNIHGQNGWEVTEGSDGLIGNQVISDEQASDGFYSFKNAFEPDFDFQWMPIFGAVNDFDEPIDYRSFTISYDVMATGTLGADFEFVIYTIIDEEFVPVGGVGVENRGNFYLIVDENYGFYPLEETHWQVGEWVNVRIEVTEDEIVYFINNELQFQLDNYTQADIFGFIMLHNNYGEDAYYDNFVIETEDLGIDELTKNNVKLYPNPTAGQLYFTNPSQISSIIVYDLNGKQVQSSAPNEGDIDLSALAAGTYMVTVKMETGRHLTRKVIKK